jgi:hypothetical protein
MSNSPFEPRPPLFPWYPPPETPNPATSALADLLNPLSPKPTTFGELIAEMIKHPRVFVSYQHSSDQTYYDQFSKAFHDIYEFIYDNSLARQIDSDNPEYVIQRIRDEFITGTSCTVVLIGPTSYQRKYLDWEIKATLDKEHGLIGIQLPNLTANFSGQVTGPIRFAQNVQSGYALWHEISWQQLIANPASLKQHIADACSRPKNKIVNPKEIKKQNG